MFMNNLKFLCKNLKKLEHKLIMILKNIVKLIIYLTVQYNYYQKLNKDINKIL
jgi:hypothetical protein